METKTEWGRATVPPPPNPNEVIPPEQQVTIEALKALNEPVRELIKQRKVQ